MDTLNWIDYILLAILLFSSVVGLMRGFLKEVIALVAWVAAFVIAANYAADLAGQFNTQAITAGNELLNSETAAQSISYLKLGVCFFAIFFVVLIIGGFVNYFMGQLLFVTGLSFTNRSLGILFGMIRGAVICVIFIYVSLLTPLQAKSEWKTSSTVAYFLPSANKLDGLLTNRIKTWKDQFEIKIGQGVKSLQ